MSSLVKSSNMYLMITSSNFNQFASSFFWCIYLLTLVSIRIQNLSLIKHLSYESLQLSTHWLYIMHVARTRINKKERGLQSNTRVPPISCACVESPYYLASFVVCFSNVIKNLQHAFDLYTWITFYLCCTCDTFLCSRTHHNTVKHSIEICLL